tara:strand:+ start:101453 stop:102616 length:1164 start_codon:yes stop_codon:yes gene_type:complete
MKCKQCGGILTVKIIFILSQVILAVGNWILLATIAKNYSLTETGDYNLALACLAPTFLFFSFHLKNYFLAKDSSNMEFSHYVHTRILSMVLALAVALVAGSVLEVVNQFFWGVFVLKASELIFELPFMYDHKIDKLKRASGRHILRSLLVYGCLVFLLESKVGIFTSFGISGLLSILGTIPYILTVNNQDWSFSLQKVASLIRSTFWLGGSASLLSLNISLPRIFLAYTLGKEATAIYSVSFAFYSVWQLLFNSYLNSILPKFTSASLKEKVVIPLVIFIACSLIFINFDTEIYRVIFGPEYIKATELSPGLLGAIFLSFISSYFFYDFMSKGSFKAHFNLNLIALGVHAIVLYPLIKLIGIEACYYSWTLALIVQCGLYWAWRPSS